MTGSPNDSAQTCPAPTEATIDVWANGSVFDCKFEIKGATVRLSDGTVLPRQTIRAFGAAASVTGRLLLEDRIFGDLRGDIQRHDGWIELTAVWDGERLIDGDGADLASIGFDEDDV